MNKKWFKIDTNANIRFLPSSGIHPTIGEPFIRKIRTNETILDEIPIVEIERYLRKKKLEKIKKEE